MALFDTVKDLAGKVLGKADGMDDLKDLASDTGEIIKAIKSKDFAKVIDKIKELKNGSPDSKDAQDLVGKVKDFISDKVGADDADGALSSIAKLATGNDDVKEKLDEVGGNGAAQFISKAIKSYLNK